jgi:hypothetical protein
MAIARKLGGVAEKKHVPCGLAIAQAVFKSEY